MAEQPIRPAISSGSQTSSPPTRITFYEEDEPVEDVKRAFDEGEHGVTARPAIAYQRIENCVNCRRAIGWTGVAWLHLLSRVSNCTPTTYADPGT